MTRIVACQIEVTPGYVFNKSTNHFSGGTIGSWNHGGVRGRRRMVYKGAIMEYIRYPYIIFNIIIDIRYHKVAIKHVFFLLFFLPFHQDLKMCCISAGAAVNCQPFQNEHTEIFASPVPGVDRCAYCS